ncbi:diacylglycerol kinase accessory domain domain-containing protein, partial [Cystoisospora suis]
MATALTRKPSPTPSDIAGVSSTPSLAQGMPLSSPSSAAIRSTPIPQTPSAGLSSSSLPISPSAIPAKDEQTKTSFLSDTTTLDPSSHSSSPHPPVKTGDSSSSSTTMEGDDLKTKPAAPRQSTAAPLISSSPTDDLFLPPSTDPPLSKNPLPSSSSSSPSPPSPGLPPISGSPPAPVPSENPQSSEGNEGEGSSSSSSSSSANVIPPGGNSSSSSGRPSLSPVGENPSKIDRRIPPTSPATTSGVPVAPVYPNKFPVKVEPTSAGPTAGNICVRRERPKSKETGGGGAGPGGGGAKKTGEGSSEEQQQEDLSSGQLLDGYDSREKPLELSPYLDKGNKPKIVFIFINPTSGGNKAAAFTESGVCRLTMTTPFLCNVYIFDIREGDSGKKPGFLLLKAATEALGPLKRNQPTTTNGAIPLDPSKRPPSSNVLSGFFADPRYTGAKRSLSSRKQKEDREIDDDDIIRVLVAGGDGTVMWCASEAEAHHIDPNRIALGVIPYGTGNDFANAFGWKQRRGLRPFDVSMR